MYITIIYGIISAIVIYFISKFLFALLLRGFSPFIQSRPWVAEQLYFCLSIKEANPVFIALSSGRSGFFNLLAKRFPKAKLIGIEPHLFSYLVACAQVFIKRVPIKVLFQLTHHVDYSKADLIYCHLYPDEMKDLGSKLKFECKPGTMVISTGFNIVGLKDPKIVDLPDREGRTDWLSKNLKLFQAKHKKFKKENKAFFYTI